jgi:hypothetical protein
MLHLTTERMASSSRPAMPAAAAAIARCCGESILARTPPVLFPMATNMGDSPASCPAATWSSPNNAFEAVTEPPIATPSQSIDGEISANTPPAPAAHSEERAQPERPADRVVHLLVHAAALAGERR